MVGTEAMTCQELLALSGALSAALPTGQLGLGSFFSSFSKGGKLQKEKKVSFGVNCQASFKIEEVFWEEC
jgi:hypothetical protein